MAPLQGPAKLAYTSPLQYPESIDWDEKNQRFIVGSVIKGDVVALYDDGTVKQLVKDEEYAGCATLGLAVDPPRNRFVVTVHSNNPVKPYDGVAAYDLDTGARQFLVDLGSIPVDDPPRPGLPPFANDSVADPATGTVYVTDTLRSLLWKVSSDGSKAEVWATSKLFESFPNVYDGPFNLGLNGIVVHKDGYILTTNVHNGKMFKVSLLTAEPEVVAIEDDAVFKGADGIRLRPDGRLVVTSDEVVWLVETSNGWGSAKIIGTVPQDPSISTTAVAIRGSRAYVNYAWFGEIFAPGAKPSRSEFFIQAADFDVDAN